MYTERATPQPSGPVQTPAHVLARKVWAAFAFTFVLSRILRSLAHPRLLDHVRPDPGRPFALPRDSPASPQLRDRAARGRGRPAPFQPAHRPVAVRHRGPVRCGPGAHLRRIRDVAPPERRLLAARELRRRGRDRLAARPRGHGARAEAVPASPLGDRGHAGRRPPGVPAAAGRLLPFRRAQARALRGKGPPAAAAVNGDALQRSAGASFRVSWLTAFLPFCLATNIS